MIRKAKQAFRRHGRACEASLDYYTTYLLAVIALAHVTAGFSYVYFGWSKYGDPLWYVADISVVNTTTVIEAYSRLFADALPVLGTHLLLLAIGSIPLTIWLAPSEQRLQVLEEEAEQGLRGETYR